MQAAGSAHVGSVWVQRCPDSQVARLFCAFLAHWFASWTANQNDQIDQRAPTLIKHVESAEKKAHEDQLQPTVQNTLRKLSQPTNKNCPTSDRQLGVYQGFRCFWSVHHVTYSWKCWLLLLLTVNCILCINMNYLEPFWVSIYKWILLINKFWMWALVLLLSFKIAEWMLNTCI